MRNFSSWLFIPFNVIGISFLRLFLNTFFCIGNMSIDCQQHEYFAPSSIVQCTTCLGETLRGEVEAFEPHKKLLILKSAHGSGKQLINVVNLGFVENITVIKEPSVQQLSLLQGQQSQPTSFNFNTTKIQRRKQDAIDKKRRCIAPVKINSVGQNVFMAIRKTIDDIRWEGDSILVMGQVAIPAPYKVDNVQTVVAKTAVNTATTDIDQQHAVTLIRKIVDKVWCDVGTEAAFRTDTVETTVSGATATAIASSSSDYQSSRSSCPPFTITTAATTVSTTAKNHPPPTIVTATTVSGAKSET